MKDFAEIVMGIGLISGALILFVAGVSVIVFFAMGFTLGPLWLALLLLSVS